jgi:hypothetical protein
VFPCFAMNLCLVVQAPPTQEAAAHSPGGPWMISSEDWDDVTETACWEQIDL